MQSLHPDVFAFSNSLEAGEYFNKDMCRVDIGKVNDFVAFSHGPDPNDQRLEKLAALSKYFIDSVGVWTSTELLGRLGSGWEKSSWTGLDYPPEWVKPPPGSKCAWIKNWGMHCSKGLISIRPFINNPLASIRIVVDFTKFVESIADCVVDHTSDSISFTESSGRWLEMARRVTRIGVRLVDSKGNRVVFRGGNICFSFAVRKAAD